MIARTVATVALGLFAAVSVGYVIFDEATRSDPVPTAVEQFEGDRLVAYYFHGNRRCKTCNAIEAYARETIEKRFPEELRSGRIVWRTLNYEDEVNASYRERFMIVSSALVLSDVRSGTERDWHDLDEVWVLEIDKPKFMAYVEREVRTVLESAP